MKDRRGAVDMFADGSGFLGGAAAYRSIRRGSQSLPGRDRPALTFVLTFIALSPPFAWFGHRLMRGSGFLD